jgi:hypothetical protein
LGPFDAFASALAQERRFTAAPAGVDTDTYRQLGVGLAWSVGPHLDFFARFATAEYTDVEGLSEDLDRYSVGVTWWPWGHGIRDVLHPIPRGLLAEGAEGLVYAGQPHRFAVNAAGARSVSLVGDFNAWDPSANPMRASAGGLWAVDVALEAGTWQYAYWVDGVLVTPPDAEVTVDDGFGGRNGLITVEASIR